MMATGDIAIPAFNALAETGQVVALVTQPDRPVGRHYETKPPRIKVCAQERSIPVYQPEKVSTPEAVAHLRAYEPDLFVVMAYGQLLSQEVIDLPRLACINAHASLLPRHRGAACIQAAIEAGDNKTGITIMHIVKKMDAGDIICTREIPLRGRETAETLHDDLARLAPDALLEAIAALEAGTATRTPQESELATYCKKLVRADGRLDWTQPAFQVARKIRAYHSWPGTSTTYISARTGQSRELKIFPPVDVFAGTDPTAEPGTVLEAGPDGLLIACGGPRGGALRVTSLQIPGGRRMNAESFFAGHRICPGMVLGR